MEMCLLFGPRKKNPGLALVSVGETPDVDIDDDGVCWVGGITVPGLKSGRKSKTFGVQITAVLPRPHWQ